MPTKQVNRVANEDNGREKKTKSEATTRKERKRMRREKRQKQRKPRRRIFPIWLRILTVLIFCALALCVGAMVGYGILGDGVPQDVLKKETWQHIIDVVTKE